jgi:hypothetical protein
MKEVITILTDLRSMTDENQYKEIGNYSVETLESLAVEIYKNDFLGSTNTQDRDILDAILEERFCKLNNNFTWTPEKIDRLLKINDKLMEVFEKAFREAKSVVSGLHKRIEENDPFLKDYQVDIELRPYWHPYRHVPHFVSGEEIDKEPYDDFGFVLSEPISGFAVIEDSLGHYATFDPSEKPTLYLNKSLNWNITYFDEAFSNYYIDYSIHVLLENNWSFPDILRIKTIWADVKIEHRHIICRI